MVFSGVAFTDAVLHQTGQGGQHVDRWINSLTVKLAVQYNLAFGNISGQVGDWMGDIVVGHGQNGDLSNRSVDTLDNTGTLIDGSQFAV